MAWDSVSKTKRSAWIGISLQGFYPRNPETQKPRNSGSTLISVYKEFLKNKNKNFGCGSSTTAKDFVFNSTNFPPNPQIAEI